MAATNKPKQVNHTWPSYSVTINYLMRAQDCFLERWCHDVGDKCMQYPLIGDTLLHGVYLPHEVSRYHFQQMIWIS